MKIDGRCHCGAISYEAEIDLDNVMICHCTDCQALSGSAFRTVVLTREGSFRLVSGRPTIYVKTGDNGSRRQQAFCPECGSPIYSAPADGEARVHSIRLGTVRQRRDLQPQTQIWSRSALPWLGRLDTIRSLEKQ
jgi:hypothetical protein